jgi:ankyrin repeat protein
MKKRKTANFFLIFKYSREEQFGEKEVFRAARKGDHKTLSAICRDGSKIDTNTKNKRGKSLIHIAAKYGQFRAVELLLNCGADPNVQDIKGRTPLHTVVFLLEHSKTNREKKTEYADIIDLLLSKGANPMLQDGFGTTAFKHSERVQNKVLWNMWSTMQNQSTEIQQLKKRVCELEHETKKVHEQFKLENFSDFKP